MKILHDMTLLSMFITFNFIIFLRIVTPHTYQKMMLTTSSEFYF